MNSLVLCLFKELIKVKKGIEEIIIILSFFGRLRKENWTWEVGIIGKAGIESRQHSCKSFFIIIAIAKIEQGSTGGSGFEIWHAMIDIDTLHTKLARIDFGGNASRASITFTATSHTTFLLRRLARLILIVWMSLKVLLFEGISCFLEMSLGLFICQLPLFSEYDGLQVIIKLLQMDFGSLTDLIVVEGRVLGPEKRMVALAIENKRIWRARGLLLLDNWMLWLRASFDNVIVAQVKIGRHDTIHAVHRVHSSLGWRSDNFAIIN